MTKKILVTLSEYGYWGEELIGPLDVMIEKGYEYTFVTPRGRKPPALRGRMRQDCLAVARRLVLPLTFSCVANSYDNVRKLGSSFKQFAGGESTPGRHRSVRGQRQPVLGRPRPDQAHTHS